MGRGDKCRGNCSIELGIVVERRQGMILRYDL